MNTNNNYPGRVVPSRLSPNLQREVMPDRARVTAARCLLIPEGEYSNAELIRLNMTIQALAQKSSNQGITFLRGCDISLHYTEGSIRKVLSALMRATMFNPNRFFRFVVDHQRIENFIMSAYGKATLQSMQKNKFSFPADVDFSVLKSSKNPYLSGTVIVDSPSEEASDNSDNSNSQNSQKSQNNQNSESNNISPEPAEMLSQVLEHTASAETNTNEVKTKMTTSASDLPAEFVAKIRELIDIMQKHNFDAVSCTIDGNVDFIRTIQQTVVTKIK